MSSPVLSRLRGRITVSRVFWLAVSSIRDYGDVLVHVFLEATRAYYALERLWGDAPFNFARIDACAPRVVKRRQKMESTRAGKFALAAMANARPTM